MLGGLLDWEACLCFYAQSFLRAFAKVSNITTSMTSTLFQNVSVYEGKHEREREGGEREGGGKRKERKEGGREEGKDGGGRAEGGKKMEGGRVKRKKERSV